MTLLHTPIGTLANEGSLSRRRVIVTAACAGLLLPVRGALAQNPASTPSCHDGDAPTLRETEGPYFKPRSPLRGDLREPGMAGRPVELSGQVLTRACRPVADALVDLWHADDVGEYDRRKDSLARCNASCVTYEFEHSGTHQVEDVKRVVGARRKHLKLRTVDTGG